MNEKFRLAFADGHFVVMNEAGAVIHTLVAGDLIEVSLCGCWQVVQVCSGGYKGWYYLTQAGRPGRFALCMKVRLVVGPSSDGPVPHRDGVVFPCLLVACKGRVQTARLNAHFFGEGGDSYAHAA